MFLPIPLYSSVTNGRRVQTIWILFYLLIRTDGLVLFISLSHLKFSSNWKLPEIVWNQAWNKETWGALTVLIKISLRSFNDTVVCRNNIEVITYSYGRGNTSVYFWSQYFFSRGPFSSYTNMSECRPRPWFFFSVSSLWMISVFIHGKKSNLRSTLIDSYSFLFKAELLNKTAEVWWLKLFPFLP